MQSNIDFRDPMVSVVIPTYNGGEWLLEAIASCFQHQLTTLEVIVVDDASTDATPDLVAASHPEVVLIRQPRNSGSGAFGRNTGLQKARGRYVKFLDHDDLLEPGTLHLEVQAADEYQSDMVMTCWGDIQTDTNGDLIQTSRRCFAPPDPYRLIEAILLGEKVPYTAGVLYRRSFIAEQKWDARLTINDDFDWFCRNALRTDRIVRLDHVSYYWRLHSRSIQGSQEFNKKSFVESVYIHNHVYCGIAAKLKEQSRLTPTFRRLLSCQLYRDLRVLVRFNPERCWRCLDIIKDLQPGFQPDESMENSVLFRFLISRLGMKLTLRLYRWLQLLPDQLRFSGGRVRYFQT